MRATLGTKMEKLIHAKVGKHTIFQETRSARHLTHSTLPSNISSDGKANCFHFPAALGSYQSSPLSFTHFASKEEILLLLRSCWE
jgi:hypothetical protein